MLVALPKVQVTAAKTSLWVTVLAASAHTFGAAPDAPSSAPSSGQDPKRHLPAVLARALEALDDSQLVELAGLKRSGGVRRREEAVELVAAQRAAGRGIRLVGELTAGAVPAQHEVRRIASEPVYVRVASELLEMSLAGKAEMPGFEVLARPWRAFGGREPARRRQPELWGRDFGPRAPSRRCQALLVPEGRSQEQWRGVQPRSELVEVQSLRGVFVSYMGQVFDGARLHSEVLLKVEHLAGGSGSPAVDAGARNLSSLLFPVRPDEHARRHGLSQAAGQALQGLLFRELALFRSQTVSELDIRFPWVRVFPPGRPLVPLLESSLLNYGHWVSKGLSRLAALWGLVGSDPTATFLIYEAPFIVDTMHYLLGSDFERRVSGYNPRVLYFGDRVLTAGPEYFDHVDNLSREAGAAVRSLLLPVRDPPGVSRPATTASGSQPGAPSLLLLSRSEREARGRSWSNFNDAWRLVSRLFGATHAVRPYICSDYTFHEQLADFAEADIVVGIDGACFGNVLWMRPGGAIVTVVPSKRNYIPIMPVKDCGYTYAWKFADVAGASTSALMLPEFDADGPVDVPLDLLERALLALREARAPAPRRGGAAEAILPGPTATAENVLAVYPADLVYDALEKRQLRVQASSEADRQRYKKGLALHRRYAEALGSAELRAALVASLRRRCSTAPGCKEDQMNYLGKLLDHEQRLAVSPRERTVELLAVRQGLLQHRPGNAFYLFQLAEQLEALGSKDGNATLLREACAAFEGALRADASVAVFDDVTRYKAWEMLVLLHQTTGDALGAQRWLDRARASGYPWRTALQLPYQRMFHPHFAAKPLWECGDAAHLRYLCRHLEASYPLIRAELLAALRGGAGGLVSFTESAALVARGNWTQIKLAGDDPATKALVWRPEMCGRGRPFRGTCEALRAGNAYASAITGAAKFYLLAPGTTLKPHCGQANLRLFMQLGIVVPPGVTISVGGVQREWKEGRVLILDDSFMHGVVHSGNATRVTMSIPVWHPDIYHRFGR